jgi:glycosyltransferase involved in cell wall biosynthesis
MRLLFITPRFLPEIGGVEKHVNYVANELVRQGHLVKIITSTYRNTLKSIEPKNRLKVYRVFLTIHSKHPLYVILHLIKIWIYLIKIFGLLIDQDAIHLHDYQTFLWVFPFLPLIRKPIFMTFHGFESYPPPKHARIIRKMAEKVVKGNICVGSFITRWYGTKPNYTTIGGVETSETPLCNNHVEEAAVFIGRLTEDTGILEYIKALKILKKKYHVELPLHICGDGPLRNKILEYARCNDLKIFIHGFVENPQKFLIRYRYAFVSGYLSILEAMSLKRPVFAIYTNNLKRDYLYSIPNAKKLMFVIGSPNEMAEKLYSLIKNPEEIEPFIKHAYAFAKEQTWEKVANLYLKLYREKGLKC